MPEPELIVRIIKSVRKDGTGPYRLQTGYWHEAPVIWRKRHFDVQTESSYPTHAAAREALRRWREERDRKR